MNRGFSLMELIFTATLLSVIILAFFNLLPSSIMAIRHAEHRIEATAFADSILEEKRSSPFSKIEETPAIPPFSGNDSTSYTYVYEPLYSPGADANHLKGMKVTVTWREKENQFSLTRELYVSSIRR